MLALKGINLKVSYDRKERKDHGEGGLIMGYVPQSGDKIAIVEDVTTAGTSVKQVIALLEELKIEAEVTSLFMSLDRMEKGTEGITAMQQIKRDFGIEVNPIVSANDIIDYLEDSNNSENKTHAANIREYLEQYGVR